MIVGIGTDLVEIHRVEQMISRRSVLKRIYTKDELEFAKRSAATLAGNFAVKEAVSKVFGTGFFGVEPYEIEVLRNEKGAPFVILSGVAKQTAKHLGITKLHVSISNTAEYVQAFVIGESV